MNQLHLSSAKVDDSMVTGDPDCSGMLSNQIRQLPDHDRQADDTFTLIAPSVVEATAATPSTEPKEDQARSPIGVNQTAHHFYYLPPTLDSACLTKARSLDGIRGESSFGDHHVQSESTLPQSVYPTSPMVTPPTRNYQSANTTVTAFNYSTVMTASSQDQKKYNRSLKKDPRPLFIHPVEGVPHVYRDFSQTPDDDENYRRKKTGGVSQPFPEKLHEMLTAVEGTDQMNIVCWLPHGRAFIVRKAKEFTDDIMPKFFKQTKLTSFQRQLNLYGFRRLTQGVDAGAYYHELFLRVRPGLCQRMTRQKIKGTGHKQPADARTEPNFYDMPRTPLTLPEESPEVPPGGLHQPVFESLEGATNQDSSQEQQRSDVPSSFAKGTFERTPDGRSFHCYSAVPNASPWRSSQQHLIDDAVMDSPGLHGAAHLLQGIASGHLLYKLRMPSSDALPQATERNSTFEQETSLLQSNDEARRSTTFLQPRISNDECR